MERFPKILIVDDDAGIIFAFQRTFSQEGYETLTATTGKEGLEKIQHEQPDLVFMDITMPCMDGLSVLEKVKNTGLNIPIVIITGYGTMKTAIQAVKLGAYEYMTKPLDVDQVRSIAHRALEVKHLKAKVSGLQAQLRKDTQEPVLVGNDPTMQKVYKTIGAVASTPNTTPVLILGKSGTGKELVAKAIHQNGLGQNMPFVAINCTALPGELLESELFGYEKGAFTGATEQRIGKFEAAGEGTIFLDEIGDMPLLLQQKLLRVIQEREFERLGGNIKLPVRARFVLATHRDLKAEVAAGRFREDLYFRISVVPISIPALKERKSDLPILSEYLLKKLNQKLNRRIRGIAPEALDVLMAYNYPGNVRELENILERAIILTTGDILLPSALPDELVGTRKLDVPDSPVSSNWREARRFAIRSFEEQFICQALQETRGNVTAAAQRSGLKRQSFQRLMQQYDVRSERFRPAPDAT